MFILAYLHVVSRKTINKVAQQDKYVRHSIWHVHHSYWHLLGGSSLYMATMN